MGLFGKEVPKTAGILAFHECNIVVISLVTFSSNF